MILIVDTESDIETKEIISIQLKWGNCCEIIKNLNHLERIEALWNRADAIVMFNAPYDLGVLATLHGNTFEYKHNAWKLNLFGNTYRVKRINGFRNLIKGNKTAPPVIDVLKLWSILIDDRDISLKSLIKRELHEKPIPFTPENAQTRAYQLQDVVQLEKIWQLFLVKTADIPTLQYYGYKQYAAICTPATFAKINYAAEYPNLKEWQEENHEQDKQARLSYALEVAYNGGITVALHHGTVKKTAWYDIHGAYAHVNEFMNIDTYKKYQWEEVKNPEIDINTPYLCRVKTDTFLTHINASLKIFQTRTPRLFWMWSFDILALKILFPKAKIDIQTSFKCIPLVETKRSLCAQWSDLKEQEEKTHGKTTLREYYKFLSNTSYGITAQRKPYSTIHTNLAIAGIVTSRAHLILCQMIGTARRFGCRWLYSDTDSICVSIPAGLNPYELEAIINKTISPYSCGCEFVGKTRILSLKRYLASDGDAPDKIRLHGKSIFRITEQDIKGMLEGQINNEPLIISQIAANTAITYKRVLKLNPNITNPHPFMFTTNIKTDETKQDFFDKWILHIDTKLSIPKNARTTDEFKRNFFTFDTYAHAELYYESKQVEENPFEYAYRNWDMEDELIFIDEI